MGGGEGKGLRIWPLWNTNIHFKVISQMSEDDIKTIGITLGMGYCLDNSQK